MSDTVVGFLVVFMVVPIGFFAFSVVLTWLFAFVEQVPTKWVGELFDRAESSGRAHGKRLKQLTGNRQLPPETQKELAVLDREFNA